MAFLCRSLLVLLSKERLVEEGEAQSGRRCIGSFAVPQSDCELAATCSVHHPTIAPNLSVVPRQHLDAPHLDHPFYEAFKEDVLVGCKAVDVEGGGDVGVGDTKQVLVDREQSIQVLQVGVVLVVEHVRGVEVEVVKPAAIAAIRAARAQLNECFYLVHDIDLGFHHSLFHVHVLHFHHFDFKCAN
ncbi:hypothetical protein ZIOFF_045115 [Zingiber officinale]|uniref:Secreted protein n=1 Tax=Zingiber officinale TaxID=94328 RepID=A0A8J5FY06_ZINOF|nr:hypothetical protein ZIOFF_045115 [Zingiber officinale]